MKNKCSVRGVVAQGAMCGAVLTGGEFCGSDSPCLHQSPVVDQLTLNLIMDSLRPLIVNYSNADPSVLIDHTSELRAFGFDEVDMFELIMDTETEFDIQLTEVDVENCTTVGDLVLLVNKELAKC